MLFNCIGPNYVRFVKISGHPIWLLSFYAANIVVFDTARSSLNNRLWLLEYPREGTRLSPRF
jgi:hypothetical protein